MAGKFDPTATHNSSLLEAANINFCLSTRNYSGISITFGKCVLQHQKLHAVYVNDMMEKLS